MQVVHMEPRMLGGTRYVIQSTKMNAFIHADFNCKNRVYGCSFKEDTEEYDAMMKAVVKFNAKLAVAGIRKKR